MLDWDPERIAWFVRLTARISASLFAVDLAVAGLARAANGARRASYLRTLRVGLLLFVTAHTVHFGWVLALARATDGANIEARGGWLAAFLGAFLFYSGFAWIWQGETRPGDRAGARWSWLPSLLVWGAFVQAYLFRVVAVPGFALLVTALAVGLAGYLRGLLLRRRAL